MEKSGFHCMSEKSIDSVDNQDLGLGRQGLVELVARFVFQQPLHAR